MSTSDDIKKMTQKFVEDKSKQNLQGLSLEGIAQTWASAKESPDFEQQKENMSKTINDEILQNKINEYLVNLNYGRFSAADFPHITEFCEEFGYKFANSEIKSKIDNLKETMETCRLNMPKEVNIKFDDKLKTEFAPIPHLEQITISGNQEQIKDLDDKKQTIGKSFSFIDENNNTIGGVEFDKENNAHILYTNKDGNVVEYKLTPDNKFFLVNDDKSETPLDTKDAKSLSTQDTRAYNLAKASQKIWKKYINKEIDKNVQKPKTTFNQSGKQKTTVNEGENEETAPTTTRFDEGTSKKKNEADFNNEADNEHGFPDNKFEWKEDDIIKVMFQDWFLAAANSATSFALNHIEYAAAGIWDTMQKSYRNRPKEEDNKEEDKPDITHQFYSGIEDISKEKTKSLKEDADNQKIIDQIKNGNIQDVIIQNDLLRNFGQQTGINVANLLNQGEPEKTVPLITSIATLYAGFTDTYARASILDGKMNIRNNFIGMDPENLYNQRRENGSKILNTILANKLKENNNKGDLKFFADTITNAYKDINKALELGKKDYNKKNYDEHDKKPHQNKILQKFNKFLHEDEAQDLHDFAQKQSDIISNRDFIVSGINTEQQELDAAEHDNNLKRQRLNKTKNFILKGLTPDKEMTSIIPTTVPFRPPYGQERE